MPSPSVAMAPQPPSASTSHMAMLPPDTIGLTLSVLSTLPRGPQMPRQRPILTTAALDTLALAITTLAMDTLASGLALDTGLVLDTVALDTDLDTDTLVLATGTSDTMVKLSQILPPSNTWY